MKRLAPRRATWSGHCRGCQRSFDRGARIFYSQEEGAFCPPCARYVHAQLLFETARWCRGDERKVAVQGAVSIFGTVGALRDLQELDQWRRRENVTDLMLDAR